MTLTPTPRYFLNVYQDASGRKRLDGSNFVLRSRLSCRPRDVSRDRAVVTNPKNLNRDLGQDAPWGACGWNCTHLFPLRDALACLFFLRLASFRDFHVGFVTPAVFPSRRSLNLP